MRVVVVGSGGVGDAVARIAARRGFFERMVVADRDPGRAARTVAAAAERDVVGGRFVAAAVDASDPASVEALLREHAATHVLDAVDPRFVMPVFSAAQAAGVDYVDMAMSLSTAHPTAPYEQVGVKLGDAQLAAAGGWEAAGRLALVGIGVEPGLSDVFARYAADHLFSRIEELGVRDGANLVVRGEDGEPVFAPSFSIWTTIEECLNPPVVDDAARARAAGDRDAGWHTVPPFHEPEVFDFPAPIGPVECVHVEHEEVLLMPRWVDAEKVTFTYGLGEEFIGVLRTLHALGLDSTAPVRVGDVTVSPRDVVAAVLPDPATLGPRMEGATCAGLLVTGTGKDGAPREVYLHHIVDNAWSTAEYGAQCVVWQTAVNPRRRPGAPGGRPLVRHRGPGPRGLRRGPVPRPPGGPRSAVPPGRRGRAERVEGVVRLVLPRRLGGTVGARVAPRGEHRVNRAARRADGGCCGVPFVDPVAPRSPSCPHRRPSRGTCPWRAGRGTRRSA